MKPVVIDLCCGRGGWSKAFIAQGWRAIGFDVENHGYPGELVLQDIRTLDGRQLKGASAIVASAPCQEFTRHLLPWLKRKNPPEPDLSIVGAVWRIHSEAERAAGHQIPFIMENVRAAQWWLGTAAAHFGSRYLWGDVPAVLPYSHGARKERLTSSAVMERAEIPADLAEFVAQCFKPC